MMRCKGMVKVERELDGEQDNLGLNKRRRDSVNEALKTKLSDLGWRAASPSCKKWASRTGVVGQEQPGRKGRRRWK